MKGKLAVLLCALAAVGASGQNIDNALYVKQFPGTDVGTKITNAMAACNPALACYIVVDSSLGAFPAGVTPAMCSHCFLLDYRLGSGGPAAGLTVSPLAKLYQGTLGSKKVGVVGNSTVSNATELFQELAQHGGKGDAFDGFSVAPEVLGTYQSAALPLNEGSIYNYGCNGKLLTYFTGNTATDCPYVMSAVISAAPDLIIFRGYLINDVRGGGCDYNCAVSELSTALNGLTTGLPNSQILLTDENSLLTTDPGSYGWVTAVSATETLVDGAASGVTSTGVHTVTLGTMPTSIYAGQALGSASALAPAQVIINSGQGDQETVYVTAVAGNTFTAKFAATHTQGFTAIATMPTAAQSYSAILRDAVLHFQGAYPNVAVLDLQQSLFGTTAPAVSGLMLNQLHPGPMGRIAEADLIAQYLVQVRGGSVPSPQPVGNLMAYISGLLSGSLTSITAGTGSATGAVNINGVVNQNKVIHYQTNGADRFYCGTNGETESGSNTGANYVCSAIADNGSTVIDSPLYIQRSTGNVTFDKTVTVNSSNVLALTLPNGGINGISLGGRGTGTLTAGAAAGTSPTIACTTSHNCSAVDGTISLTAGSSTATGALLTISSGGLTHSQQPNCFAHIILAASPYTELSNWTWSYSTSLWTLNVGTALTASTAYTITYHCLGY